MKIDLPKLKGDVLNARQEFTAAQHILTRLDARAKTAKREARKLKIQHKRARSASKAAKRLVREATEAVQARAELLAKAEKRLAKAHKKLEQAVPAQGLKSPLKQHKREVWPVKTPAVRPKASPVKNSIHQPSLPASPRTSVAPGINPAAPV